MRVKKGRCPPHPFPLSSSPLPSFLPSLVLLFNLTPLLSQCVSLPHRSYYNQNFQGPSTCIFFIILLLPLLYFTPPQPPLPSLRGSVKCQCIVLGDRTVCEAVRCICFCPASFFLENLPTSPVISPCSQIFFFLC